ncbi:hypothetical protein QEH42_gp168 [Microbacterium phage Pumpernickel]|uniref:Uncharacterized protein n=1 Tax=Microbacterium phage Pumpernickel TaxID=2885983 RepID=A0AAE8Y7E3_9CAUD|nr:hypothetical protein QEH42_gp168 [Microbacterium phage Pumpernickel]UDL16050.1 hypothetical protein SEA_PUMPERNICKEL_300 [Microbacterium phage Pumpernickel]
MKIFWTKTDREELESLRLKLIESESRIKTLESQVLVSNRARATLVSENAGLERTVRHKTTTINNLMMYVSELGATDILREHKDYIYKMLYKMLVK